MSRTVRAKKTYKHMSRWWTRMCVDGPQKAAKQAWKMMVGKTPIHELDDVKDPPKGREGVRKWV